VGAAGRGLGFDPLDRHRPVCLYRADDEAEIRLGRLAGVGGIAIRAPLLLFVVAHLPHVVAAVRRRRGAVNLALS